jgi:hypothetical protein
LGKERLAVRVRDPYVLTVGVVSRARQGGVSVKRHVPLATVQNPMAVEAQN